MQKAYFENIESILSTTIASAEKRIYIAVAWFTNDALFNILFEALNQNVEIKVIILDDLLNRNEFGLDFGILSNQGAEVRFAVSINGTMHHKFCIVDDKVITGSYNWTYHANKNNENIILTDELDVVSDYCNEFENLFNTASPIKLPYEHLKWTDVKEGDFSELRRNIFREVIAHNDIHRELKRIKLINLDHAYKSGNAEELANAALLPIEQRFRTITDVLTSRSQDFTFKLWEENIVGKPFDDVDGHAYIGKWWYIPNSLKEDQYHREYIEGTLNTDAGRNNIISKGLRLNIYDEEYIATVKKLLCGKTLSSGNSKFLPDNMLRIDHAKMFFYQFPSPMFNKSQPRTWKNTMPRTISSINLLGIVKDVDGDNIVFYDGWNPQKKGEKIMKEFFVNAEESVTNFLPTEQHVCTITDVLTDSNKKYKGELFYQQDWGWDEQPVDVRYSTIGKWIFIPEQFGETIYHEKYVRGYFYFYNWYKKRDNLYKKIQIDIYDDVFISTLNRYIKDNMDISIIPEHLICINLAKLFICKYPEKTDIGDVQKAIAVLCIVKEANGDDIVYYEGWDPQTRVKKIVEKLCHESL
jgi:hypothetical protein